MDSGNDGYARKRGYSKVHVLTWTIYLEKNGFVPCSFQNCTFMAFSIVEMKNHFQTCKGEGFQAAYECKYCKGRTEHADKLEEHILRAHRREADSAKGETNCDMDVKRTKELDEDKYSTMNVKPEISKVVICSWDVSKEMYGYIKCPDCCLLSESVEEMKSHVLNCQKNPSVFAHECPQCNGRVPSQKTLDHHLAECHKDSILEDDAFIENYSHSWKDQIDSCGFAKCGTKCPFIHIDISTMKKHFKDSCSKESGCLPVIYCSLQSCSVWSTSRTALVEHKIRDHNMQISDSVENSKSETENQRNCKSVSKGKLNETTSVNISPDKYAEINDFQLKDELNSIEIKQEESGNLFSDELNSIEIKQEESGNLSSVKRFSFETEVQDSMQDCLQNLQGCENTGFLTVFNSKTSSRQFSKKKSGKMPTNDDPYQLQSPSDIENKITIDDPLTVDDSWVENSASNEMTSAEKGNESNEKRNEISDNSPSVPGMKTIIEKTRRCYSKMAAISKKYSDNDDDGDDQTTTVSDIENGSSKQGLQLTKSCLSKQKTYSSYKNCGISDKVDSNCSGSENVTQLSDRSSLVNKLNDKKDNETLKENEVYRISEETETSGIESVTTKTLPGTFNVNDTEKGVHKGSSECKVNSKSLNNTSDNTDNFNNSTSDVSCPENDAGLNLSSSQNKKKRGRPKKMSIGVKHDPGKNLIQCGIRNLGKISSRSKQNLEGEALTLSTYENFIEVKESSRKITSDMEKSLKEADSTSSTDNNSPNSSQAQKKRTSINISSSLEMKCISKQDDSSKIKKKRGRPRKISSSYNFGSNFPGSISSSTSQEDIKRSEELTSDLGEGSTHPLEEKVQEETERLHVIVSDSTKILKEKGPVSSSHEGNPNTPPKIQKKRGRPRKISIDGNWGENCQNVVSTFPSNGSIVSFKEKNSTNERQLGEEEPIPQIKEMTKESNKINSETKKHCDEIGTISSQNDDISLKIEKKRGRPRKISNSVKNSEEVVSTAFVEQDFQDGKESRITPIISLENQKKRGRPKKVNSNLDENLKEVIPNFPTQEKNEKSKDISNNQGEHCNQIGSTYPSSLKVQKKRGRKPKKLSSDLVNMREMSSISSMDNDPLSKIPRKRGRPKKVKLSPGESLGDFSNDNYEVKNPGLSRDSVLLNIEESKNSIDESLTEQPIVDSCAISTIDKDSNNSSISTTEKSVKKRGRPRKLVSTISDPDQTHREFEPVLDLISDKTTKRNIMKPKKYSQYVTEDSFFDANEAQSEEPVSKVQSISAMDDQNESSASGIPKSSIKKRPGRPKKTLATNLDIDYENQSFNDPQTTPEVLEQSKRKRTVSKPLKFSSYITENSDLEEALGNDGGELLSKATGSSEIADIPEDSSKSNVLPQTLKRKRGRPKKNSISAINISIDVDNFNSSLDTKQNLCSTPTRNLAITVSKPKKYMGYDYPHEATGSSEIADSPEDSSKSNVLPQTLKRKRGRPKKISISAINISIDVDNFNSSLDTKQNFCSTPTRSLARTVSKPKKYKGYYFPHASEKDEEDFTDQTERIDSPRNFKRSSMVLLGDRFNPDIQPKIRKKSEEAASASVDVADNEGDARTYPLDKTENISSVNIETSHEKITTERKKRIPPPNISKKIICAVCKKSMTRSQYELHASQHNYLCWVEGDVPIDPENEDDVHRIFFQSRKFKSFKGFKCEKCGINKKSSVGYISHKSVCGISDKERESLKLPCPVCKRFMMRSSLKIHMNTEHRPTTKVAMGEVVSDMVKRAAATRAESLLEDLDLLDNVELEETKSKQLRKWFTKERKETLSSTSGKLDLDKNNELVCSEPSSSFKTDGPDVMQAHHSKCTQLNWEYECRICGTRVKELHEVKQHILTNHAQIIENDCSDFEGKEEFKLDEDDEQQESQQNSIYGKPNFLKEEFNRTGLNFLYRNMQRNQERLQANNFQGHCLYKDFLAVPNGFVNEDELSKYLPITPVSMRISLDKNNWEQLKLMEARSSGETSFVFVGGPVWAMDWCPVPLADTHQWLAVSCHRDMDAVYNMTEVFSFDNVIQIWDFGKMDLCGCELATPVLSIGIGHSHGTAWDMRWCPDGCHQPDSGRLGLLAVAFSSGTAVIYSVPLIAATDSHRKPFYRLTPVAELTPPYEDPVQCCRIAWSCDCPYNFVAVGYMDGSIALYDITTSSLLLKDGIKIHPYKVFNAHLECITGLQFIGNKSGNTLMSTSLDKCLKFWNLLDTSAPISVSRRTPIRDAVWLDNWLCAVSVDEDCYTSGMSHLNLNNFRHFLYLQTVSWIPLSNTQWSLTASEWTNAIAMASESGKVVTVYPNQLFYIDTKAIRRVTMCLAKTVLKKLTPGEDEDQEGENVESYSPSNYNDATNNYGLVLSENCGSVEEDYSKHIFPITSVNKVSYNPNRQAFTYLAIGQQCGIVRVTRDKYFDFAKEQMRNFSSSLLLR